jgi:hypothetical protein
MANTKISQLPSYTGTAADLRWFVMNNSGETETFKFSGYSSPYKVVGTTNSNNIYDTNAMGGDFSSIVAGENNTIPSPAGRNFIGGGIDNEITGSQDSVILGSYDCIIRAVGRCGIYSSYQGDITQTPNYQCAIMASAYCSISYGNATAIVGGYTNTINGTDNDRSVIIGGESNTLTSTLDGTILNGGFNTLTSSPKSSIVGGYTNTITNSTDSSIIGGTGNTMSGKTNVVMLGTSGRTASADNTTYVENLRVFRQAQYGNFNNGSRATNYTIDWDNGNIQKVVLTGSCVFSATNITDGTTYIFKVSQDNSGNRAATWSSGIFKFANSTPPTLSTGANAVDIFTFVAMDGLLYGVAQLNFG